MVLRPFAPADLPALHALTSSFGWPHRPEDLRFMARHGTGIVCEQGGTLAGCGFTWCLGPRAATLGLVVVDAAQQGRGIGRQVMRALLDGVGERSVLLHATEAGAPLYESLGFAAEGLIRQYQGIAAPVPPVPPPPGQRLRALEPADHAAVLALDAAATGLERAGLLRELLREPGGAVLDEDGTVVGFALQRRFGRGQLIGPAAARDDAGARALIAHQMAPHAGHFVRLDVPEAGGLGAWLLTLGMADAGPGLRMVRGAPIPPGSGAARMAAMMSQALG